MGLPTCLSLFHSSIGRGDLAPTNTQFERQTSLDLVADPAKTPMSAFLLGVMLYVVIACGFRRGTHGPNKYGESPLKTTNTESISDEGTEGTPQRNQVEPIEAQVESQTPVIQANDEETYIDVQNNEVEMVSRTDESIPDDPPLRIWELILKFWKHTGAMVVIGIYTLLTLSLKIESFQVVEVLPAVLVAKFINITIYYWLPICLVAGLFSFLKKDPKDRVIRFRRTVFWGILIVLFCMAVMQIILEFHKSKVESLEGEYSQTTIFEDTQGRFQVSAPSAWSEMPDLNEEADMTIGEEIWDFYFQVFVEPKSDFEDTQIESLDDYKDLVLEMMTAENEINIVPVTLDVELNEYNTIQAEMEDKLYGIVNIIYYLVFVEDTHSYYQLIGLMNERKSSYDPERRDIKKEILQNVINSFQIIN